MPRLLLVLLVALLAACTESSPSTGTAVAASSSGDDEFRIVGNRIVTDQMTVRGASVWVKRSRPAIVFGDVTWPSGARNMTYVLVIRHDSDYSQFEWDGSTTSNDGGIEDELLLTIGDSGAHLLYRTSPSEYASRVESFSLLDYDYDLKKGRVFLLDIDRDIPLVRQVSLDLTNEVPGPFDADGLPVVAESILRRVGSADRRIRDFTN